MQEHNFDQILDFLCSGIMSKSERQNVRDELYDHLMCRYETNLAVGMDEERATESAINDLGDKNMLKFKLSQVHSYYPALSMKKALNLLICGYLLADIQINLFTGMGEITKFIGNIVMIVAMFCLSKANKRLKQAFLTELSGFTITCLSSAIQPLLSIFYITNVLNAVSSVLSLVSWILLFMGLFDLVKPYSAEYPKKIPFGFAGFCHFIIQGGTVILLAASITTEENVDLNLTGEIVYILMPLFIVTIIATVLVFSRVSKCLWQSDHEYRIEASSNKKAVAAIVALALGIVPVISVDIYTATQKAETSLHTIEDAELSQSEYDRITGNLFSYGIPERVVYNLPKSEILNYSGSINKSEFPENVQIAIEEGAIGTFSDEVGYDGEFVFSNCAIGMRDSEGYPMVRMLCWVEYTNGGSGYNDAVFFEFPGQKFLKFNDSDVYENDFLLILSEENDKIIKNEPLSVYNEYNMFNETDTGVRFECKENLLIIHAENLALRTSVEDYELANYSFDFVHRNFPLAYPYRAPNDFKENGAYREGLGFSRTSGFTMFAYAVAQNENTTSEENYDA